MDKELFKYSQKIPEGYIISSTFENYVQSIQEGRPLQIYSNLNTLVSLVLPYLTAQQKIDISSKLSKMKNMVKEYILRPNEELKLEIISYGSEIQQTIWECFGEIGLLPTKEITIRIVPDYFKEIDRIYKEKYGKVIKEEIEKRKNEIDKIVSDVENVDLDNLDNLDIQLDDEDLEII